MTTWKWWTALFAVSCTASLATIQVGCQRTSR